MKNLEYHSDWLCHTNTREHLCLSDSKKTSLKEIDCIQSNNSAIYITISGLDQKTFEYFIKNYGQKFHAINFWKCPRIHDLSILETLDSVKYITWYWNNKSERLWDFSKNPNLKGLCFDSFTRIQDLTPISKSKSLLELQFGCGPDDKYIIDSLEPLSQCECLKSLIFSVKKLKDEKIQPLGNLKKLKILEFPLNLFSTEQVAWLKARLPKSVASTSLQSYKRIDEPLEINNKNKDTFIIGKRKPFLDWNLDKKRIENYTNTFNEKYEYFLKNPKVLAPDP